MALKQQVLGRPRTEALQLAPALALESSPDSADRGLASSWGVWACGRVGV